MSDYISFPSADEIVSRLRPSANGEPVREDLCRMIAERLASRTYESAAFAFILMEVIHELEARQGQDLTELLPRCILALTGDRDLARSAVQSFEEIKRSLME